MLGYSPTDLGLKVSAISGNEAICLCPYHNDTKPSASFNMLSGWLYCFACGYAAKADELSKLTGGIVERKTFDTPHYLITKEKLWRKLRTSPLALNDEYLKKRLVDNDTVLKFDIRHNKHGIVFPFKNHKNEWSGCQIRHYAKKPKYLTFGERNLWPLPMLETYNPQLPIYLTEGVFGAIRGYQAGFQTLAVIGAMIKEKSLSPLQNYNIIGLFDNDLAGYIAGARLLKFLPHSRIAIPGIEADEYSLNAWCLEVPAMQITRDIKVLASLSGNEKEFNKFI